jgi:hypothetical protein
MPIWPFPTSSQTDDKNLAAASVWSETANTSAYQERSVSHPGSRARDLKGAMHNKLWLRLVLGGFLWTAFRAAPGLPLPGGLQRNRGGKETIDIDTFYDEVAPYGQWVWHPRHGYVATEMVSARYIFFSL